MTGPSTPPVPAPEDDTRWHTVKPGETLMDLARRYYGDPARWREIQRANGLTSDEIRTGERLVIP